MIVVSHFFEGVVSWSDFISILMEDMFVSWYFLLQPSDNNTFPRRGEQEQIRTVEGKEEVFLKKRLGFIKLALEQQAAVVPCYAFGCVDLYATYTKLFFSPREWLRKTPGTAPNFEY